MVCGDILDCCCWSLLYDYGDDWKSLCKCITFLFSCLTAMTTVHCFPGKGMSELSLADRATIANMSPEYGATMGFFPVDKVTLQYLRLTGRDEEKVTNFQDVLIYAFSY